MSQCHGCPGIENPGCCCYNLRARIDAGLRREAEEIRSRELEASRTPMNRHARRRAARVIS